MTDTAALIARVRELDREATPGPWVVDYNCGAPTPIVHEPTGRPIGCGKQWDADSQFIAQSRTLAVQLADALEAAEAEVARLASICTRANPYLHRIGAVSGSVADRAQTASEIHEQTQKQLTASRERERRLREALEHFARAADECREDAVLHMVSASRLRFARAALAAADGETGGGT